MEELLQQVLEQNKRIIEQNRKINEQLTNVEQRMQSLEQKAKFANAVSVVNNRSVSMLSNVGCLFNEDDQDEALTVVKNMQDEGATSLATLIDLSREKYI